MSTVVAWPHNNRLARSEQLKRMLPVGQPVVSNPLEELLPGGLVGVWHGLMTVPPSSRAVDRLRQVAHVRDIAILDQFIEDNPDFFSSLAGVLAETHQRYREIIGVEVGGYVDPEEGHTVLQVELSVNCPPTTALELRSQIFHSWLRSFHRESPLPLEVLLKPA